MDDGTGTVFLNTCGNNRDQISPELAGFLDFVHADLEKSQEKSNDPYIAQLQDSIKEIKVSREMGVRYVLFTEKLEEEYRDGYEAGEKFGFEKGEQRARISIIQSILSEKGSLNPQLEGYLEKAGIHTLDTWLRFAFEAENCEMFLHKIGK